MGRDAPPAHAGFAHTTQLARCAAGLAHQPVAQSGGRAGSHHRALRRAHQIPVLSLQILVRNRRQDLMPYIQRLLAHPQWDGQHPPPWYALAHSQADLLQKIAAERTLIERHVYLIIPASQGAGGSRRRGGMPALFGTRRAQRIAQSQEQARQELALRAEALAQQLSSCGLTCQRLTNADLARLYYECLTPERASAHPLSDTLLASVGQPTRVQRRSQSVPQSHIVRTPVAGDTPPPEPRPALH